MKKSLRTIVAAVVLLASVEAWAQESLTITKIYTPAATDLTLAPSSDVVLNPTGKDVMPGLGYDVNLGSLVKKYLTLHAAELWVETLVAQNTMATIGGRILVAPTTTLTSDLSTGATSIIVKHNNLANGDRVYLEANASVEFMAITSAPSGSGPYTYTVTRNLDGSGANAWTAGDAVLNTGQTGNGFWDIYSVRGVKAGTEIGPTMVANQRTGSTYNAWEPRAAIGNLNGLFGYSGSTYGAAFGVPSGARVTIDATNGIRIYGGDNDAKVLIDTSGNATFDGELTVGTGRNMIRNSDCRVATTDWNLFTNTGLTAGIAGPWPIASGSWGLGNTDNDCYIAVTGTPGAGTISSMYGGGNSGGASAFPAQVGKRYEASAYLGVQRSGNTNVLLQWLDSAGALLSNDTGTTCTTASAGGTTLAGYCRSWVVATAPASTAYVRLVVQTTHTASADPFLFIVHTYLGEAGPAQEDPTPWGAAGTTSINNGLIETDAINARTIAADSVTSAKIVAGTIVASDIAAGTITADRLNVSTLSAITANMGTITAGTITGGTIDGATVRAGTSDEVVLDGSGITIANGTSGNSQVKWSDGSQIGANSGSIQMTAGSSVASVVAPGEIQLVSGNGGTGHVYMSGDTPPQVSNFVGLGTGHFVCHDNAGNFYSSATTCDGSAPAPTAAQVAALQAEIAELRAALAQLVAAQGRQ